MKARLASGMIEAGSDVIGCVTAECSNGYTKMWFAKVSDFPCIDLRNHFASSVYITGTHQKDDDSFNQKECLQIAFMQVYDVLGSRDLPIDKIDETLHFLRLQWQGSSGEETKLDLAKLYGLTPIVSMRGLVQVVPCNELVWHQPTLNE